VLLYFLTLFDSAVTVYPIHVDKGWSNSDPKAELVTALQLEGRIQCDLRDRQQLMLLHCYPQSEAWHSKKSPRILAGWTKLVGGPQA